MMTDQTQNPLHTDSRVRLILHGKAAARPPVREAVRLVREGGHEIEVRVTWEGGDTQRLTREAVADGVGCIVAGGGDGTLNEVASTMAGHQRPAAELPSFGMLPQGTANDFARSCGVPLDPTEALRLAVTSDPRPIDLGRLGDRYFINVATGGVGTEITVETPEDLKELLGGAAYFVTAIKRLGELSAVPAAFAGTGFEWSGAFGVLGIGNGRQAGGGNVLCPEASLDDGLLDVRILPHLTGSTLHDALRDLIAGGAAAIENWVVSARVPWVEIQAQRETQINLDGEPVRASTYRFKAVPAALRAHLPADCPLVG